MKTSEVENMLNKYIYNKKSRRQPNMAVAVDS